MNKIIVIIGLIALLVLFWQLIEVDYQRDKLSDRVQLQEKQIQAIGALVSETEKERDEKQKNFESLIADLKNWANENQSSSFARQYSTITNCNPNFTGGFRCSSY